MEKNFELSLEHLVSVSGGGQDGGTQTTLTIKDFCVTKDRTTSDRTTSVNYAQTPK